MWSSSLTILSTLNEKLNVFGENRFLFDQLTSKSLLAKLNLMMMMMVNFLMIIKLMMMMITTMTIMMIMMMVWSADIQVIVGVIELREHLSKELLPKYQSFFLNISNIPSLQFDHLPPLLSAPHTPIFSSLPCFPTLLPFILPLILPSILPVRVFSYVTQSNSRLISAKYTPPLLNPMRWWDLTCPTKIQRQRQRQRQRPRQWQRLIDGTVWMQCAVSQGLEVPNKDKDKDNKLSKARKTRKAPGMLRLE